MTKKTTENLRSLIKINGEIITVPTKFAPMLQAAPELLAAIESALRSLDIDGPSSAASVLNTLGRVAVHDARCGK